MNHKQVFDLYTMYFFIRVFQLIATWLQMIKAKYTMLNSGTIGLLANCITTYSIWSQK